MTTYTMSGSGTLRDIGNASIFGATTARTGNDVFNLNGKTLTIDEDTRYGASGLSSGVTGNFHLGNITSSATLGGDLVIDGTKVWMIPFTGGSGTLTAGTQITIGGVTCNTIGLYSALNVAPVLTGVSSGWLKVTNASGTPGTISSGTYAGVTLTANGSAVRGFIEVVGYEAQTITIPLLGSCNITGAWFAVGTTTGSNSATYQLPTNGNTHYFAGVFVEKTAGQADYEFYPCVGTLSGVNYVGTDQYRGKVCWISTAGVLRFGSDGTNSIGYVPASGLAIVIPNIILTNCATSTGATNATPNSTLGSRYDFTTTWGGQISIDKAMCAWYPSFSRSTGITISNTAINEQLYLYYVLGDIVIDTVGVGLTAAQAQSALRAIACTSGLSADNCAFASYGSHVLYLEDCSDFEIDASSMRVVNASGHDVYITRCSDMVFNDPTIVSAPISLQYSSNVKFNDLIYCAKTGSANTRTTGVLGIGSKCLNTTFDGLTFPDSDAYSSSYVVSIGYYGSKNTKLINLGSESSPLDFATVSVRLLDHGGDPASDTTLARVWYSNNSQYDLIRTNNSNSRIFVDSLRKVAGSSDGIYRFQARDMRVRGARVSAMDLTSPQTLTNGTFWNDYYTSDTAGYLVVLMNAPSDRTAPYITLTGGAQYTGAGKLYMPTVGMSSTFEMDYTLLGHTGFSSSITPTMSDGTFTNYKYEFQYDTGSGWSAWSAEYTTATGLRDALASISVNYATGVKLKLRVTTVTTNTTPFSMISIRTTTTADAQKTLYPLASCAVQVTNLATGSRVKAVKVSDGSVLFNGAESSGSVTFSISYEGLIEIDVRKASSSPYYRPFVSRGTTVDGETLVITALQQLDE